MITLQQVKSFVSAIRGGKNEKLRAEREIICQGCDQYQEHPKKNFFGKWIMQGFCKACGCGMRSMADMKKDKTVYVQLKCPLLKWPGDVADKGIEIKAANALFYARECLEYSIAMVQNMIDRNKPMDIRIVASIGGVRNSLEGGLEPQQQNTSQQAALEAAQADPRGKVKGVADADAPKAIPETQFNRAFDKVSN